MKTLAAALPLALLVATVAHAGSRDVLHQAELISRQVNSEIAFQSDADQYGQSDRWVFSPVSGKGDCEDYAFTKVKRMEAAGIPARVAICVNAGQTPHAVTLINDGSREWVLDSATRKTSNPERERLRVMYGIAKDSYTCQRWVEASALGKELHAGQ